HAPALPQIYALSLHDALPISDGWGRVQAADAQGRQVTHRLFVRPVTCVHEQPSRRALECAISALRRIASFAQPTDAISDARRIKDRKSTRLNSSHVKISYAVF